MRNIAIIKFLVQKHIINQNMIPANCLFLLSHPQQWWIVENSKIIKICILYSASGDFLLTLLPVKNIFAPIYKRN